MKIEISTDDDRVIAVFESAEEMDYLDYSADLDVAIRDAIIAEGRPLPDWLRPRY
jgi:hypothetical protein